MTDWEARIAEGESRTIEFKSDRGPLPDRDLIETVVCLANGEGGHLFIGVEDDGSVTGLHVAHQNRPELLPALIASRTVPPLAVKVTLASLPAHGAVLPVAIVEVPVSKQLIATSDGRLLVRSIDIHGAPGCRPLYPHELAGWRADRGQADATAQPIQEATWEDLDPVEFARLRRMVEKNRGDAALLELSDQEIANALGMVHILQDRPIPTLAGLLLVGKESALRRYVPAHEVAFQVLRGTDVAVNEFRHWPLLRIHEWLMQAIEVRNEEQELMSGGIRVGISRYDPRGIREAVNNALLHRDYGMLGAVHVQLHQDHVLIMNPGGFVMNVRPDNVLMTPPRPRNPLLADGFKRVGLVERTGRGVSIIFSGQLRSGRNPPSYALSTASSVTVIMDSRPADMAFVEQLIQGEKRLRRLLTVAELLILQEMWVVGEVSLTTSAGLIQRDKSFARQVLREMQRHRLIRIVNDTPDPVYSLGQSFAHASEQIEVGLDGEGYVLTELEAQVLSLACQLGQIQRQQVEALSGLSRDQAYRLLRHLVDKGILELVGKGRGAHYQLTDRVQRGNVR